MTDFNDLLEILNEAELTNPLNVQLPDKKLTSEELIAAIRQSIIAEQDAIALYETYANATDNADAKVIFEHIVEDEKHHLGEFQVLLEKVVGPEEQAEIEKGRQEAEDLLNTEQEDVAVETEDTTEEEKELEDV